MSRSTQRQKTLVMVEMAMLVALVVVLQLISAVIPPIGGTVSITLTLIPVVVGAVLFGIKGGITLGLSFGVIVLINCITGLDPGGNMLWNANPFFTAIVCLVKGAMAGVVPALLYKLIASKKENLSSTKRFCATLVAALSAPIMNTGFFVIGMMVFFIDTLQAWAGGSNIVSYVLFGLAGLNFVVEFLINVILTPAIVRVLETIKTRKK